MAVTGSEMMTIPPMVMDKVDVSKCAPVFAGMKYCTALQYVDAFSQEMAPYFPFTGDSKWVRLSKVPANNCLFKINYLRILANWLTHQNRFVVELHPTGEVTEYTATVAYELLKEGEEGRQKVDSVKFILRAEGNEQYWRKKNVWLAQFWNSSEV